MSTENKIPSKPTADPKSQLADKSKAMNTGSVVTKGDGMSAIVGNDVNPNIGHKPTAK